MNGWSQVRVVDRQCKEKSGRPKKILEDKTKELEDVHVEKAESWLDEGSFANSVICCGIRSGLCGCGRRRRVKDLAVTTTQLPRLKLRSGNGSPSMRCLDEDGNAF